MDSTTRTYRREETTSRSVGLDARSGGKALEEFPLNNWNHISSWVYHISVWWCRSNKTNVCFCRNLWHPLAISTVSGLVGYPPKKYIVLSSGQIWRQSKSPNTYTSNVDNLLSLIWRVFNTYLMLSTQHNLGNLRSFVLSDAECNALLGLSGYIAESPMGDLQPFPTVAFDHGILDLQFFSGSSTLRKYAMSSCFNLEKVQCSRHLSLLTDPRI